MATQTPQKPEDGIHGEEEKRPLFPANENPGSVYDASSPVELGKIPTASQEGIDHLRRQHTGGGLSGSELKDKEERADTGPVAKIDHQEKGLSGSSDSVGRGYNPIDSSPLPQSKIMQAAGYLFASKRRKKTAGGAIAGSAIFVIILSASIAQGPMQLIQFSELIDKFHLSSRHEESNSRVIKATRYIYHTKRGGSGGAERVRLGYFSNKYADKIEQRLRDSGIETAYTNKRGYRAGFIIDPDVFSSTEIDKYKRLDPKGNLDIEATQKAIQTGIEKDFGAKVTVQNDGTLFVESRDGRFFQGRAFDKFLMKKMGYGNSVSAVNARIMGKRAGLTWHPVKKLDRKLEIKTADLYNKWKEERKTKIKQGSSAPDLGSGVDSDSSQNPGQNAQAEEASREQTAATQAAQEAGNAEGADRATKLDKFRATPGFKAAAGSAAAVGVACMIKQVDDGADEIKEAQVILPAMRIAGDFLSLGSQLKAGDDLDMKQVGFFVKQLHGTDASGNVSNWNGAETTRAELGKSGGVAPSETLKTIGSGSPFAFINQGALGSAVGATCSTAGQIVTAAIGIATGPISFAVGTAGGVILGPVLMSQLVDWVSGNALPALPVGADLGNVANFGGHLMARQQGLSNGGRELSKEESAEKKDVIRLADEQEFHDYPLQHRLFAVSDSRSLAAKTMYSSPKSVQQAATTISSFDFWSVPVISSLFPKQASASTKYNYGGISDAGFSEQEMNNPKVENPFQNGDEVISKILPAHSDYIDRAKKCWGIEVDSSTYDITDLQAGTPKLKDTQSAECNDKSEDFLQFRMYVFDTNTILSLACREGDDEACTQIGFGNSKQNTENTQDASATDQPVAKIDLNTLYDSSDKIACADGSKDLGVQDGYHDGKVVKVRVCALNDAQETGELSDVKGANGKLVVNSRLSAFYVELLKDAKKAGVTDTSAGEGFRSMARQKCLYDGPCPKSGPAARPGYSNHQMGVAVDWGDGMIAYLNKSPHGLKAGVSGEPWHWSPTGN